MYTLKYCQLCLVVNVRTFAMNTATLAAYSKLLRLPLHNKEPYICYECSALLLKYQQFHAKCLRAHNVLTHFKMQSSHMITHEVFETQRKMYNLESNLSLTTIFHETIEVQGKCSKNEVNTVTSNENSWCPKIDMLHVKNETKPHVYGKSDYYVIEQTYDEKPLATKDIQETIDLTSDIHLVNEPSLPNIKQLLNTATNEAEAVPPPNEIYAGEEHIEFNDTFHNSELPDTLLSNLHHKLLPYINKTKKMPQKSAKNVRKIKRKKCIHAKEKTNKTLDTSVVNVNEELSDTSNSKELVDKATQIVKSVLHEKYVFDKQENDTNEDSEDKLLQNIGNSEELVKKATAIVNKLRKKRKSPKVKVTNMDLSLYDGFARVVKMTPEEAREQILLRRGSVNYLESPYKCELCYRGFTGQSTYDNHLKRHSEEHGSFECEFCRGRFLDNVKLGGHVQQYHQYKIFCTICTDYVTCSVNHAREHIRKHKGKTFQCDECDAIFSHRNNFLSHKNQVHPRDFNCDLCGNTFGSQRGLTCHKKIQHKHYKQTASGQQSGAVSGPRCAECALQFASEAAYARHRSLLHQRAASQDCEFCGETFSDYPPLRAHVSERHTPEKPKFCCLHCPFRFWDHKAYKSHLAAQHQRPRGSWQRRGARAGAGDGRRDGGRPVHTYVCEYCGKDVNIIQRLYHRLKHTGERPYKCKLCDKGFAHPTMRKIHMDTHATTRQYQCDKCPKNYKLKANLARHIRTVHSKIRPHACPVCGKMFPFPCELKLHVKYTHENVPWPKRIRKPKAETHNY